MAGRSSTVRSLDCVVYINGRIWGVVEDANWAFLTGRRALYTLDRLTPAEQMATRSAVSGTMTVFRKHDDAGLEGVGATPVQNQLPAERYFFLQILDISTGTLLLQVEKAAVGQQQWHVAARQVLKGTFDWSGIAYETDF